MTKKNIGVASLAILLAITILAAGCGGGGGGATPTPPAPQQKTLDINLPVDDSGAIGERQLNRTAAAAVTFAGKKVYAYEVGYIATRLNAAADVVGSDEKINITIDLGDKNAADIIVEILMGSPGSAGAAENLKIAFQDLAEDIGDTDGLIDYSTTRKAEIFALVPSADLTDISKIENLFANEYIDVTENLTSAPEMESLLNFMNDALAESECPIVGATPDYDCMAAYIQGNIDDLDAFPAVKDVIGEAEIAFEVSAGDAVISVTLSYLAPDCNSIQAIVDIFNDANVDIGSIDKQTEAESLCEAMADIVAAWDNGSASMTSLLTTINQVADTVAASTAPQAVKDLIADLEASYTEKIKTIFEEYFAYLDPTCPTARIQSIAAIGVDAIGGEPETIFSAIDTQAEAVSLCDFMADPAAAWDAASGAAAKRLAAKEATLKVFFGEVRPTISSSSDTIYQLIKNIRQQLAWKIGDEAAAGTTLVTAVQMENLVNGYDDLRGIFIEEFVTEGGATSDAAAAAVEGLLDVVAQLGANSNYDSSDALINAWVVEWRTIALLANLAAATDPLGMNVPAKNEIIMDIVNALADNLPASPTDAQIKAILAPQYMTTTAADAAIVLYHRTTVCSANTNQLAMINCFTANETLTDLVDFLEEYYEKSLPKLRPVLDGIIAWYKSPTIEESMILTETLTGLSNAQAVATAMQTNETEMSGVLEAAGVKPELFLLYLNLSALQ